MKTKGILILDDGQELDSPEIEIYDIYSSLNFDKHNIIVKYYVKGNVNYSRTYTYEKANCTIEDGWKYLSTIHEL